MKKQNLILVVLFLIGLFLIQSCRKDEFEDLEPTPDNEVSLFSEGMIQLSKKLENPYTVVNMKKAYQNLIDNGQFKSSSVKNSDIKITHYYVRFLPKSFEELAILQKDTTLELFDYPLDYEMAEGGTYYQDPDIPFGEITWQYCAVEEDFDFPSLQYEILEELFLPKEKKEDKPKGSFANDAIWDNIEIEALKITGNLPEKVKYNNTKGIFRDKWNPSGTIKVWDAEDGVTRTTTKVFDHWEYYDCDGDGGDEYPMEMRIDLIDQCQRAVYKYITTETVGSYVPVVGCKARVVSWFTVRTKVTNSNGQFYIDDNVFKGHVNYSIKWERADFDLRSGNWGQAYYNGPRLKEKAWNLNISDNGLSWMYAHMHHGAYTYYYKHGNYGIQAPPRQGGILNQRLHIGAMDKSGTAHYYDFNQYFTTPQIKIYRKNDDGRTQTSIEICGTTIHELAHASHWDIGYSTLQYGLDYLFDDAIIPESWAVCVAHVITTDLYGDSYRDKQDRTIASFKDGYTPVFIDLIDTDNQRQVQQALEHPNYLDYPEDRVHGYTLGQLEDVLKDCYRLNTLENKLTNNYVNSTEEFIGELFNNYD